MLSQNKKKIILSIVCYLIIIFSTFLIIGISRVLAQELKDTHGWAWFGLGDEGNPEKSIIGWMSLNCANQELEECDPINYKVQYSTGTTKDFTGYAWAGMVETKDTDQPLGWLDFDADLGDYYPGTPYSPLRVNLDTGEIYGWAQIVSMQEEYGDDWGWIKFGDWPEEEREAYWVKINDKGIFDGWAWSGDKWQEGKGTIDVGLGWISMNCYRDPPQPRRVCNVTDNYAVNRDEFGYLHGFAWIGEGGSAGKSVAGWMKFDWTYGSINCAKNPTYTNGCPYFDLETGYFYGYAWLGGYNSGENPPYTIGWVDLNPNPFPSKPGYPVTYDDEGNVSGWGRLVSLASEGENLGYSPTDENWGWVLFGYEADDPDRWSQSVVFDPDDGSFNGYAWSGGCLDCDNPGETDSGLGWISFGWPQGQWIQAEQGSIFALGDITSEYEPPAGHNNATYLIMAAGDITGFTAPNMISGYPTDLEYFKQIGGVYRNGMAKIDIDGLGTEVNLGKNKYGHDLEEVIDINNIPVHQAFNNTVYVVDQGSTLTEAWEIKNGVNRRTGAGTIIVKGNLTIEENITYEDKPINEIDELASLTFIIEGDLDIEPTVTNLAGNFIVLGDIKTGTNGSDDQQLVVSGLMVGQGFEFQRNCSSCLTNNIPSEQVFYDGRLFANPSPGMVDFISGLPVWREVAP